MDSDFKGRHFQGEIILWALRWYCKYGISYRELAEMFEEIGVKVNHTTIYRWVQHYAPELEKKDEAKLRCFIEAIYFISRTGCQWCLLPPHFGKWF